MTEYDGAYKLATVDQLQRIIWVLETRKLAPAALDLIWKWEEGIYRPSCNDQNSIEYFIWWLNNVSEVLWKVNPAGLGTRWKRVGSRKAMDFEYPAFLVEKEELIKQHLSLVAEIAAKYEGRTVHNADLAWAGLLGLNKAAEEYVNGTQTYDFEGFAKWHIRHKIMECFYGK